MTKTVEEHLRLLDMVRHRRYYLRETKANLSAQFRIPMGELKWIIPEPLRRARRRKYRGNEMKMRHSKKGKAASVEGHRGTKAAVAAKNLQPRHWSLDAFLKGTI
jgi:hypothetical protein